MKIATKRIYEKYSPEDGVRILVDRLWPRGVSKAEARLDFWLKDVAPSPELRKWFAHDPEKWPEFKLKYISELRKNKKEVEALKAIVRKNKVVTLLYAAKDTEHNEALVLKDFLERR